MVARFARSLAKVTPDWLARFAAPTRAALAVRTTRMLPYLEPKPPAYRLLAHRRTGRRVTFEYTLLSGVNDDIQHVGPCARLRFREVSRGCGRVTAGREGQGREAAGRGPAPRSGKGGPLIQDWCSREEWDRRLGDGEGWWVSWCFAGSWPAWNRLVGLRICNLGPMGRLLAHALASTHAPASTHTPAATPQAKELVELLRNHNLMSHGGW